MTKDRPAWVRIDEDLYNELLKIFGWSCRAVQENPIPAKGGEPPSERAWWRAYLAHLNLSEVRRLLDMFPRRRRGRVVEPLKPRLRREIRARTPPCRHVADILLNRPDLRPEASRACSPSLKRAVQELERAVETGADQARRMREAAERLSLTTDETYRRMLADTQARGEAPEGDRADTEEDAIEVLKRYEPDNVQ